MTILQKQPNKDFIILNLSDPQMNDEDWIDGSVNKDILINTVTTLINRVNPDLITITGDLAEFGCIRSLYKFTEFIDSFNIPWASVLGNHDNEFDIPVVLDALNTKKHSLFEQGDPDLGCGNYVVAIKENEKLITALLMMDTHDNIPGTRPNGEAFMDWGMLIPQQVEWYSNTVNELNDINKSSIISTIDIAVTTTTIVSADTEVKINTATTDVTITSADTNVNITSATTDLTINTAITNVNTTSVTTNLTADTANTKFDINNADTKLYIDEEFTSAEYCLGNDHTWGIKCLQHDCYKNIYTKFHTGRIIRSFEN